MQVRWPFLCSKVPIGSHQGGSMSLLWPAKPCKIGSLLLHPVHFPSLSPLLPSIQLHWPSSCSPNISGTHLPEGFCMCCSFFLVYLTIGGKNGELISHHFSAFGWKVIQKAFLDNTIPLFSHSHSLATFLS